MAFGDIHLWRNAGYLVAGQNELGQVDCVPPVVGVVGVHGDAGDHALHLLRVQLHQGPDLVGHADQPPVAEVQLARPPGLLHHLGVEVLGVLAAEVQGTFTLITIYINNWLHDSVRKLVSLSHIPFVINLYYVSKSVSVRHQY